MLRASSAVPSVNMDVDEMNTILFTNLQLLGLDSVDMEGKYKIPFNKDMFNLPNKAGSEVVLHFLFSRLNPSLCREQFRDCWPVIDKKTELQFRKVCNNWLTCIQKDEVDAHMPRVNAALLLSPGGRKFIHMLYRFSSYVLVQVMKSEHGWKAADSMLYPTLHPNTSALGPVVMSAIQDSCIREQKQFFERLHFIVTANRKWKEYTDELVKGFRGLTKSYRDAEHEKRLQVNVTADNALKNGVSLPAKRTLTMFDSDRDVYAAKRGQRIEKARSQWKALTRFNNNVEEAREVVRSVLDHTAPKHVVDGTDMGVRVPGLLLRECNKEIHKREIDNVYSGGRLNLVSVVLLWNICLKLYKEQLKSEELPAVSPEIPKLSAQAHKHHAHLMSTQELREEMKNKTLPRLRHSVTHMQRILSNKDISRDNHKRNNELGLVLSTPTPPASAVNRSSNNKETPTGPLAGSVYYNETPDAVMSVADKIEAAVQRDTLSSEVLSSVSSFSNLLGNPQRFSNTEKVSHPASRPVKEQNAKLSKAKSSSGTSHLKKTMKSGPSKSALPRHSSAVPVSRGKQESAVSSGTPRSSKQKALDALADTIVDSVLQASPGVLTDLNDNRLSPHGDIDKDAFTTKNLIERSPVNSMSETDNRSESHYAVGGARPKTSPVHSEGTEDTDYSREKSNSAWSPVHRKNADENASDTSHSFTFDHTDSDRSNNAALTNGGRFMAKDRLKLDKRKDANLSASVQLAQSLSGVFTPEHIKSSAVHFKTDVLSSESTLDSGREKIDRFININSGFITDDQAVTDLFESSRVRHHNISSLSKYGEHLESDSSHRSHSPFADSENVNRNNSSFKSQPIRDSPSSHSEFTRSHERFVQSFFSSSPRASALEDSTNTRNALSDKSPDSRQSYLSHSPVDMPDRRPGDGQASAEQGLQPNKAMSTINNNTNKDKQALAKDVDNNLLSLSPPSNILPASGLSGSDRKEAKILKSDSRSESKSTPSGQRIPGGSGDLLYLPQGLLQNFDVFGTSPGEQLLDLDTGNVPNLINLDSADEGLESEQDLNDSYVPFKQGICLDSRTPTKSIASFTPSRIGAMQQQSMKSSEAELPIAASVPVSVPLPEDDIQAKLAVLQQKVSDILGNSMEDYEPSSPVSFELPQSMVMKKQNQAMNMSHDDIDLLNSELINTNLIGMEDLSP